MPTIEETTHVAEGLLQQVWGRAVRLDTPAEVLAEHGWPTVLRCTVSGGERDSVIVKTYRSWAPYDPTRAEGPATGLFAEWAALAMLDEDLSNNGQIPKLHASSRDDGVLIIEDLGRGSTLEDVLIGDDDMTARNAVVELGRVLARVHGSTVGRRARYEQIRSALGPLVQLRTWIDTRWTDAMEALRMLEIEIPHRAARELERTRVAIAEPGRWGGVCHSEPGSDNAIVPSGRLRLIDFEASYWGHVAADVAFPRMAFGHLPVVGALPASVVDEFEDAYADEFSKMQPDLASKLSAAIDAASVWLALECLGAHYKLSFDETNAPYGGERGRRQLGSQWTQIAQRCDGAIGELARGVLDGFTRVWQAEVVPVLSTYAAFQGMQR